jgi:hypothetical protein
LLFACAEKDGLVGPGARHYSLQRESISNHFQTNKPKPNLKELPVHTSPDHPLSNSLEKFARAKIAARKGFAKDALRAECPIAEEYID